MSVFLTVQIENADQIKAMLASRPVRMVEELSRALEKSLDKLHSEAKKEAPVNKQSGGGNLRDSIRSTMVGGLSGVVSVGVQYGIYVHEGTKPHTIKVVRKLVLANKRTNQIFGKVVHHPGTKANPFLQRAITNSQSDINRYFKEAVENVINK